ncbi:MAG: substrate-binding domain-containing protein, partial [Acidobacteriaceae bacterium]|nr:substrate-binding domain-containing protein [Acidobacteriaceae bacterium]
MCSLCQLDGDKLRRQVLDEGRLWVLALMRHSLQVLVFAITTLAAAQSERTLPAYQPHAVGIPRHLPYVLPDGSIRIVGTDGMKNILAGFNALFIQSHPGFKFVMQLKPGYVALPELTYGISAFGPMARESTDIELVQYRSVVGQDPLLIRIAHGTIISQTRTAPLAIYVNKHNPLDRLTTGEAARIFTTGAHGGDITSWSQLDLEGEWANRPIHPIGTPEDSGFGSFMLRHKMSGRPFTPAYETLLSSVEIVRRVGEDPAAIGFCALGFLTPETKLVAIAEKKNGYYSRASAEDVISGTYPYDRYVFFFVRQGPGQGVDPFVKEYLRLVLSKEGQQTIAAEPDGYLPLNAREVAE